MFMTELGSSKTYCSEECSQRYARRTNKLRRNKRLRNNGDIDYDISLDRLVSKHKGICYLCNDKVDKEDYRTTKEGHFIAGDTYPSVDHVIPISKGGTHTWDNVKLAHRRCNYIKSDSKVISDSLVIN